MDLSLVPTNELIDEIIRRHDAVVMVGIKYTNTKTGEYVTFRNHYGNRLVCNGLIGLIHHQLAAEELVNTKPLATNGDR